MYYEKTPKKSQFCNLLSTAWTPFPEIIDSSPNPYIEDLFCIYNEYMDSDAIELKFIDNVLHAKLGKKCMILSGKMEKNSDFYKLIVRIITSLNKSALDKFLNTRFFDNSMFTPLEIICNNNFGELFSLVSSMTAIDIYAPTSENRPLCNIGSPEMKAQLLEYENVCLKATNLKYKIDIAKSQSTHSQIIFRNNILLTLCGVTSCVSLIMYYFVVKC